MLYEWLCHLAIPCPPAVRRMGYLRELIAISARYKRCAEDWQPHILRSKAAITAAAARCTSRGTALILGSGLLHDIPLAELSAAFDTVLLADIFHMPRTRRVAQRLGNVTCIEGDFTGVVAKIAALRGKSGKLPTPEHQLTVEKAAIRLVVSTNVLSQLPTLPAARLRKLEYAEADITHFSRAIIVHHLEYLRHFEGAEVCLLADTKRQVLDMAGDPLHEEDPLLGNRPLEQPEEEWDWLVAPLGEYAPDYAIRNRVACWRLSHSPSL